MFIYLKTLHICQSSNRQRGEAFSQNNRVVLPCRQPGGWSARGQPCDAVHSIFRRHMTFFTESSLGYRSSILNQATSSPLMMSNGNPYHSIPHLDSVMAAVYGWKRLGKSRSVLRRGRHVLCWLCWTVVSRTGICLLGANYSNRNMSLRFLGLSPYPEQKQHQAVAGGHG